MTSFVNTYLHHVVRHYRGWPAGCPLRHRLYRPGSAYLAGRDPL